MDLELIKNNINALLKNCNDIEILYIIQKLLIRVEA